MISDNWSITSKLENWFSNRCNYYSYNRLNIKKLSKFYKPFNIERKNSFTSTNSLLLSDSKREFKRVKISRSETFTGNQPVEKLNACEELEKSDVNNQDDDNNGINNFSRRWKSLRTSFSKRNKHNDVPKNIPVLPKVLQTYDKGVNRRQSCWL